LSGWILSVVAGGSVGCGASSEGNAQATGADLSATPAGPTPGTFVKSDTSDGLAASIAVDGVTSGQVEFSLHWEPLGQTANGGDRRNLTAALSHQQGLALATFASGADCELSIQFLPDGHTLTINQTGTCTDALGFAGPSDLSGQYKSIEE
jgi:hypothetical protein